MTLRSPAERLFQTVMFEAFGLVLAVPVYRLVTGASAGEGTGVLIAVTLAVLVWSALHNAVFDAVEWRLTGRVASDRPQGMRVIHALSHEGTAVAVSLPILLVLGGLGLGEALTMNVGLTAVYTAYAFAFHRAYDWWRPVGGRGGLAGGVDEGAAPVGAVL